MNLLASRRSFLLAPAVYLLCLAALAAVWGVMEPNALRAAFDADGKSFFEVLTLPCYMLIVPTVWVCCPFGGSALRKGMLCTAVSVVACMAVVKELDLHIALLSSIWPDVVAGFKGTPFKMRFITSGGVPFAAKIVVLLYFTLFFGIFAALLLRFLPRLFKGFFRLHPVAWTMCCFGASGVMVQICDRLPAWWRHVHNMPKTDTVDAFGAFCTAFEEGGEMMIALFALLAILQAHAIYAPDTPGDGFADL